MRHRRNAGRLLTAWVVLVLTVVSVPASAAIEDVGFPFDPALQTAVTKPYADRDRAPVGLTGCYRDSDGRRIPFSETYHAGEDWFAAPGTEVYPIAPGRVIYVDHEWDYGGVVVMVHRIGGQVVTAVYGHLWAPLPLVGQEPTRADVIGRVSGDHPGGSHLHWEVRKFLDGGTLCRKDYPGPGYTWPKHPDEYDYLSPSQFVERHRVGRFPTPAPSGSLFSARYESSGLSSIRVGETVTIGVGITNTSGASWPRGTANPVRLSYHWRGPSPVWNGLRTDVSGLSPGAGMSVALHVRGPDAPGAYTLEITAVQEGIAWFEDKGVVPRTFSVQVGSADRVVTPPIPASLFSARYESSGLSSIRVGETVTIGVGITNTSGANWPRGTSNPVNLSYHWQGSVPVWDGLRTDVSGLSPSAGMSVPMRVRGPDAPGRYTLVITAVQEGVAWFEHRGVVPLAFSVQVTGGSQPITGPTPVVPTPVVPTPGSSPRTTYGIPALISPPEGASVRAEDHVSFAWSDTGASQYRLEAWNDTGAGSLSVTVRGTSAQYALGSPGTWRWQVRSVGSNGQPGDAPHTRGLTVFSGPPPPPYPPTHAGQTVSHNGNSFRSDNGRDWIFQGTDAERARNAPVNPGVFRVVSPSSGTQFQIDQIAQFSWDATIDERGQPVEYELKINDIVSPEQRTAQGATREYVSPRLNSTLFTPPQSFFRAGFSYEWSVEAISTTNTRRVAEGSFRRFSVTPSASATPPSSPGPSPSGCPANSGEFRNIAPVRDLAFPINQIPSFEWALTSGEIYELKINDIVSPELRASKGATREYVSPRLSTNCFTPPSSFFREGFSYEWVVEAINSNNSRRGTPGNWRFSVGAAR